MPLYAADEEIEERVRDLTKEKSLCHRLRRRPRARFGALLGNAVDDCYGTLSNEPLHPIRDLARARMPEGFWPSE